MPDPTPEQVIQAARERWPEKYYFRLVCEYAVGIGSRTEGFRLYASARSPKAHTMDVEGIYAPTLAQLYAKVKERSDGN